MTGNLDLSYIIAQQTKPLDEKIEDLKKSFSISAKKLDFIRKSNGMYYTLGSIGGFLLKAGQIEVEYRIWKSLNINGENPEYLYSTNDYEKAKDGFKKIVSSDDSLLKE